jgi:hypothetical protein
MAINESEYPELAGNYIPRSEPNPAYNCAAFVVGVEDEWWEAGLVWPDDLEKDDTIAVYVQLYERYGFEVCPDGTFEAGHEKIALYGFDEEMPDGTVEIFEHAAIQVGEGQWKSKMGADDDIEHSRPEVVAKYNWRVMRYMKRQAT